MRRHRSCMYCPGSCCGRSPHDLGKRGYTLSRYLAVLSPGAKCDAEADTCPGCNLESAQLAGVWGVPVDVIQERALLESAFSGWCG
jgi:hypothetical protein